MLSYTGSVALCLVIPRMPLTAGCWCVFPCKQQGVNGLKLGCEPLKLFSISRAAVASNAKKLEIDVDIGWIIQMSQKGFRLFEGLSPFTIFWTDRVPKLFISLELFSHYKFNMQEEVRDYEVWIHNHTLPFIFMETKIGKTHFLFFLLHNRALLFLRLLQILSDFWECEETWLVKRDGFHFKQSVRQSEQCWCASCSHINMSISPQTFFFVTFTGWCTDELQIIDGSICLHDCVRTGVKSMRQKAWTRCVCFSVCVCFRKREREQESV